MGSVMLQNAVAGGNKTASIRNHNQASFKRDPSAEPAEENSGEELAENNFVSKHAGATLQRHITIRKEAAKKAERHDKMEGDSRQGQPAKAWMYPELEWGMPSRGPAPRNFQEFLKAWEMVTAVACLYVGFMVPFSLGFEKLYFRSGEQCLLSPSANLTPLFAATRIVDIFVDLIFWVDIFVNFVSARWVLETEPMVHWTLVDDLRDVAKLYMHDTFIIDVLGSIPVQYIDCIPGVNGGSLKMIRMLRLFKLFRLRRLDNLITMLQKSFPGSAYIVAFIELFTKFVLVAHITACLFFWIAYGFADPHGTEYQQHLYENGWIAGDGTLDEEGLVPEHGTEPWVSAMYWAVTTMSTIGYGDISPHTSPERLIGMGLMCIGCAFFAWITGKITQLMTEKSSCEERFDNLKEDVDTFMSQRHLPAELQAKINDYYKVRFPNKKVFDEDSIIADIEAPALKKEIVHHLFRDVVEMVPLFKLTANETQREICFKLRSVYRMPGRVITVAGQKPDNMYMIRFGQVEIKSIGPTVRTATPGCIFGELAIMGLTPENKRIRTSIAVSVCELCELSKESFYDLIGSQGGFFGLIRRASQMHLLMLKKNFECAKLRLDSREDSEQDEHFYDAMTYCPWDAICAVLAEEQEAEAFRKRSSQFDPDKIMQLEKLTGKKMLLTSIRFQFNSLGVLRDAGPLDSAVIVVTWPGVPGLSLTSVHNETEMFSVTDLAKGDIDVHRGINLPIIFPHGIRIKDLPPFTITVLTQNETTLQAASPSKMRGKDVTLSADFANAPPEPVPDRSMLYPSSSPLLVAHLAMEQAVTLRGKVSGRTSFRVALSLVPSRGARTGSASGPVELQLSIDMFRKVQCKAWGRIMQNVVGRGASAFFVKKMSSLITKIVEQDESFLASIREKRLEVMASFARNKNKSSDVATGVLNMDDVDEAKPNSVRQHDGPDAGKHDTSTIQLMNTIMQKLDQQAEELKHIKAALALGPPLTRIPSSGHEEQPTTKQDAKANTASNPSNDMPARAPAPSPRQHRLRQLSIRKESREIGEG